MIVWLLALMNDFEGTMLSTRRLDRAPSSPRPAVIRLARRLLTLCTVPIVAAGLIVAQAPAASAADSKTDLGVSLPSGLRSGDIAAGRDKLFVSAADRIAVANAQGSVTDTIHDLPGVSELASVADGSRLYAAVRGANQVVEIDTETLAIKRRIDLTAYPCPSTMSLAGSRLYVGYGCSIYDNKNGVVSFDVSAAEPGFTQVETGLPSPPLLAAAGGTLAVGITGRTPSDLLIYDVSGATVTRRGVISGVTNDLSNPSDLTITSDGATLFSAFGYPYRVDSWDTTAMTRVRSYGTQPGSAITLDPDGSHLVGGMARRPTVEMFDVATAERTFEYTHQADQASVVPGGIAISGTTVFVVLRGQSDRLYLARLPDVTLPAGTLSLTAPTRATVLEPLTLTGRLTLPDGSTPGVQTLSVIRQRPYGIVESLPEVKTAEDGTFTVTDTPQAVDLHRYEVVWEGTSTFRWTTAWSPWFTVDKRSSSVTVTSSPEPAVFEPLTLTGRLALAGGSAPGAQRLAVSRKLPGDVKKPLTEVTTADDGTFTVTDTPSVGGVIYYEVSWAGDSVYSSSLAWFPVTVAKRQTVLTLSGPEKAIAGEQLEVSGKLDGGGRLPSPNAVLTVQRTFVGRDGTVRKALPDVTVSDDGSFTFTDTPDDGGEYTYSVKWAGDSTFAAAAEATHLVTVRGRPG
ncbi:YncE family protein [Nonomuraea sp. JJY05]|uniref:YncE family protein n=1 Tax=Nonomuraea sp. JJY05 TaxID=3350255 RepID=UPI00373DF62B